MDIRFVIVVVCLNSGDRLQNTLNSIYGQTYRNIKIVVKDGGSKDGSLDELKAKGVPEGIECSLYEKGDRSIYDAMNQAMELWSEEGEGRPGTYVQFLNCGDYLYDETVLEKVAEAIKLADYKEEDKVIFYGNRFNRLQSAVVTASPELNEFALYRNVPCHQVCFYDYRLFENRSDDPNQFMCYNPEINVRGDYEHFLHSVYDLGAKTRFMDIIVCSYEGGGYSETAENRRKSDEQLRMISEHYMGNRAKRYRLIMKLSGAGIRTYLSESPRFSGMYNGIKTAIYKIKR